MIFLQLLINLTLNASVVQTTPEVLFQSKDWTAVKEFSTELNSQVCMATTQLVDTVTNGNSELRVVKIINADGTYSSPFILVTSESVTIPFYKGVLKSNSAKAISLNLLQGESNLNGLISKYADSSAAISNLKAANTVKVDFMAQSSLLSLNFSLSGSSKTISALEQACP